MEANAAAERQAAGVTCEEVRGSPGPGLRGEFLADTPHTVTPLHSSWSTDALCSLPPTQSSLTPKARWSAAERAKDKLLKAAAGDQKKVGLIARAWAALKRRFPCPIDLYVGGEFHSPPH